MGVDDQAIKRVENAVQIVRNSPAANRYCQLPKEGAVYENDGLSPLKIATWFAIDSTGINPLRFFPRV